MKSFFMIGYLGFAYLALGILMLQDELILINTEILPHIVASLVISSASFSVIEFLQVIILEAIKLKKLEIIKSNNYSDELYIYKRLYNLDYDLGYDSIKSKISKIIFFMFIHIEYMTKQYIAVLYSLTFVGSVLLPLYKPILSYNSKGLTLVSFGLFIATFGIRESYSYWQENLKNKIWFDFYKTKAEEKLEEI